MVSEAMVSGKVSIETTATEADIFNAEALSVAQVQFHHRVDIPHKRELVAKLFAEIEALTDGKQLIVDVKKALSDNNMEFVWLSK